MVNLRSQLVYWQYYATLIRALAMLYILGYWARTLHDLSRAIPNRGNAYYKYLGWSALESERKVKSDRLWLIKSACWLVFAVVYSLNDIFMLVIDHKRTDTYLGCILAQMVTNFSILGPNVVQFVQRVQWNSLSDFAMYYPEDGAFAAFVLASEICSLCLIGINLQSILALRPDVPVKQLCKANTKDALNRVISARATPTLSLLGHPRDTRILLPRLVACVARFTRRLFLRRIKNVESQLYAFARNSFAVIAIGILIFRTITALLQAQNEFGTRFVSKTCDVNYFHNISVLSDRLIYDSSWPNAALPNDVSISVSVLWNDQGGYGSHNITNCTLEWSQPYAIDTHRQSQNRTMELFSCRGTPDSPVSWPSRRRVYLDSTVYRVEVRPILMDTESRVLDTQMPHIWLANLEDFMTFDDDVNWSSASEIREYIAPLTLLRDSHILTEPNLIVRKFITSSMLKDIILSAKSSYRSLSLYPMSMGSSTPLSSSSGSAATVDIHPTLAAGLMYHQHQAPAGARSATIPWNVCDYIEDYRSSTILDVIGSVGGLFALLQAAHLLLFGRPLFWGLTGAKTITPFGLLGGFCSRGFRRRLREQYHGTSDEDGTDTIRIVKFLRDFVIDFGPADLDPEERLDSVAVPSSSTLVANDRDYAGTQM
ncbi:putative Kex protein [Rhizoctonia solani 123E]|uniref:Putative Kex protein n=1 Tax=Rhizoctonia solani 123E TaxID=1423351 RepID=A0A074RSU7_9AGAM|nr:putative Kex protein [Rhizoctonia solani 123E]